MLGMGVVWLFIYDMSITFDVSFDMSLMVKIMTSIEWCYLWIWYGWKVLILLVFWMIFWFVNKLVLMCYFFIKYDVLGRVRFKPYFIRVW